MPTFLLREHVDLFTPFVTAIVNASLSRGRLPDSKSRHRSDTSQEARLGHSRYGELRPVSNVSFLSKVIERVVARQLNSYLTENGLLQRCQSAYRRHHSTETAMLRVLSDALTAADNRQVTLLGRYARPVSGLRLRRLFDSTTTIGAELWSDWCCTTMDNVIPDWQDTTGDLRRPALCNLAGKIWCTAGLCLGPSALYHLHP